MVLEEESSTTMGNEQLCTSAMPNPLIAHTAKSSLGKENSPLTPVTIWVGATEHMTINARKVMASPVEIVHLRPILSAIAPAVAKPTTLASPPMMVRIIVALETDCR